MKQTTLTARLNRPVLLGILLLLGFGFYSCGGFSCVRELRMMHGSKYAEQSLRGLTRDEVVGRLGEPTYDPARLEPYLRPGRTTATRPWDEAAEGAYNIGYYEGGATCVVGFKDGRVASVRRYYK